MDRLNETDYKLILSCLQKVRRHELIGTSLSNKIPNLKEKIEQIIKEIK